MRDCFDTPPGARPIEDFTRPRPRLLLGLGFRALARKMRERRTGIGEQPPARVYRLGGDEGEE